MKWGLSCRASKMLSNGPTLRSLSFFYTEFGTILCCSVAVFGRGTATLHRYVFKKFVFPPQSSYGPQLFLWSKYTTRVSCLRCISIMAHMCSELQPLRGWVVSEKKVIFKNISSGTADFRKRTKNSKSTQNLGSDRFFISPYGEIRRGGTNVPPPAFS